MSLKLQILSLLFSFIYGIIFFLILKKIHTYLVIDRRRKVIYNIIFTFIISIIYFIGIYLINGARLHLYYLLSIILGILITYNFTKRGVK